MTGSSTFFFLRRVTVVFELDVLHSGEEVGFKIGNPEIKGVKSMTTQASGTQKENMNEAGAAKRKKREDTNNEQSFQDDFRAVTEIRSPHESTKVSIIEPAPLTTSNSDRDHVKDTSISEMQQYAIFTSDV